MKADNRYARNKPNNIRWDDSENIDVWINSPKNKERTED